MTQPTGTLELLIAVIQAQTAAIEANTAALAGGASAPSKTTTSAKGGKGGKGAAEKTGPVHTKEETVAAVVALKDAAGAPAARELLAKHGVDKIANVTADKFDAVYDDAVAALEAFNANNTDGEGEDDI